MSESVYLSVSSGVFVFILVPKIPDSVSFVLLSSYGWSTKRVFELRFRPPSAYPESGTDRSVMFKKNAGEEIECSREIIGGREYITFELKSYVEIAGMTLTSVITHYFTVENGYFINFQFTDSRESEYYPEFISLLESVEIE